MAIEAKETGALVKIIEKMSVAGGNSIINGGVVTAGSRGLEDFSANKCPWSESPVRVAGRALVIYLFHSFWVLFVIVVAPRLTVVGSFLHFG